MKKNSGFTLIEVIVVAAIIAILAGILVPMIFNQIDEAKKARALADCKSISTAITMFRKDTTKWPYYLPGDCSMTYLTLQSGSGTEPLDAIGDWNIGLNAFSLGNILNLPGAAIVQTCYDDKAKSYLAEDKSDPWGNQYIVNAVNFANDKPVWIMSAGPNGQLDTSMNSQSLNGDDIGLRIK
jgi:general secretion pathway protein G